MVGVVGEATYTAEKFSLRGAVMLGRVPTNGASLGSIGRWSKEHLHTSKLCLVDYKPSQLAESPLVEPTVLRLSVLSPFSYPFKSFKDEGSSSSKSLVNDPPTYQMVYVPFEPPLLAGEPFEFPLGRPSAFLLKLGSKPLVTKPCPFDFSSGKAFAFGGVGEVVDAKVNAEKALGVFGGWFLDFYRKVEEVVLSSLNNEGFTNLLGSVFKPSLLVSPEQEGNFLTSLEGRDRSDFFSDKPETSGGIEGEKRFPEDMDMLTVSFVREGDSILDGNGYLGCKAEFLPYLPIDQMVEGNPVEALSLPGYMGNVVGCLEALPKGMVENLPLFLRRVEFAFEGYLHCYLPEENIQKSYRKVKRKGGERRIPPPLQQAVSCAGFYDGQPKGVWYGFPHR